MHVSSILVDYSKAFDCLRHDLILDKLSELRFKGKSNKWVASYVQNQSKIVEFNNQKTESNQYTDPSHTREQSTTRVNPRSLSVPPLHKMISRTTLLMTTWRL